MALLLPILLVLVLGVASLGHAMAVRFMLSGATYDAARICTMQGKADNSCASSMVKHRMGTSAKWCGPLHTTGVLSGAQATYNEVKLYDVNANCTYTMPLVKSLAQYKIKMTTLKARATFPY